MIKLFQTTAEGPVSGSITDIFTSSIFAHPSVTGSSSVIYVLNHNRDKQPNLAIMYEEAADGSYAHKNDVWQQSDNTLRSYQVGGASTPNSTTMVVYRMSGIPINIQFKLHWL